MHRFKSNLFSHHVHTLTLDGELFLATIGEDIQVR